MSLNSTDRKRTRRRFDSPARVQLPKHEDLKLLKKKFPAQYNRRFREKIGFKGPLVPLSMKTETKGEPQL